MNLVVFVQGRRVAQLFRERDQYVLQYESGVAPADFVSLTMPVQASPWLWPRDLHPFFRQNLPEGYLLSILREVLGSALDGTDLSLLAVVGRNGIGRVAVTPPQMQGPGQDFSDYDKAAPAPRTGESPLLAKRRSSPRVGKRKGESRT